MKKMKYIGGQSLYISFFFVIRISVEFEKKRKNEKNFVHIFIEINIVNKVKKT